MVQDRARPILTMADRQKSWSIERRHFQLPWTTPNPDFKVTSLFNDDYLLNGYNVTSTLISLHWLPIRQRITYKLCTMM